MTGRIHNLSPILATMVSISSAILGGNIGAWGGVSTGYISSSIVIGLLAGLIFTMPLNIILQFFSYILAKIIKFRFDARPIGCESNIVLGTIMGGISAVLGALAIMLSSEIIDNLNYVTIIGCGVSTLVPIIIGLGLIYTQRFNLGLASR